MHWMIIVSFLSFILSFSADSLQGEYQRKLYKELLENYNRLERPVLNDSAPIVVELGLTLLQIIDVVSIFYTLALLHTMYDKSSASFPFSACYTQFNLHNLIHDWFQFDWKKKITYYVWYRRCSSFTINWTREVKNCFHKEAKLGSVVQLMVGQI